MRKISLLLVIFAFSAIFTFGQNITEGSLFASGKSGQLGMCPLKHTSVKADISGFLARVTVTQEFENSFMNRSKPFIHFHSRKIRRLTR